MPVNAGIDGNAYEIDNGLEYLGYEEALKLVVENVPLLEPEEIPLEMCTGRIAAEDMVAKVRYPSQDVSQKDGYAVVPTDITRASSDSPVRLRVTGSAYAGSSSAGTVGSGEAVKICSGAPIPAGAGSVVSMEFCEELPGGFVLVRAHAQEGRNTLRTGAEVEEAAVIVPKGTRLRPGYLGLAAAGGIHRVRTYRRPVAAVLGIGDEVVAPGEDLGPGQLYASNVVTMKAWLAHFGISWVSCVVADSCQAIQRETARHLEEADVLVTSGGAWGSERDLVVSSLNDLGWRKIFHHVRLGPGKGIAFGTWRGKPVFCLPGGPASNQMAFLQLALPGLLRMCGDTCHPLQTLHARLMEDVEARHPAWTEFKNARLVAEGGEGFSVGLYHRRSRLQAIAGANSLICVPEGVERLNAGQTIAVQVLPPRIDEMQTR